MHCSRARVFHLDFLLRLQGSATGFNSTRGPKDHLPSLRGLTDKTFHIPWFSLISSDGRKTKFNVQSSAATACACYAWSQVIRQIPATHSGKSHKHINWMLLVLLGWGSENTFLISGTINTWATLTAHFLTTALRCTQRFKTQVCSGRVL